MSALIFKFSKTDTHDLVVCEIYGRTSLDSRFANGQTRVLGKF